MKAETFEDLIEWNAGVHDMLANIVRKVGGHADDKALNTWLYEHLSEELLPKHDLKVDFNNWDYERISKTVFDIHNQIIDLYRSLLERAPIPEAGEVMRELYDMQKHETLRLADQVNNGRSL